MSDSLQPHGLQHSRPPCPSLSPGVTPTPSSRPLTQWCHPTISSSVTPFSSCPQFFPASGSFPMIWLFASGGQSIGVSVTASVLPVNNQGWFPLGLTDLISLLSKELSRDFFSTTVWKHQFFGTHPSFFILYWSPVRFPDSTRSVSLDLVLNIGSVDLSSTHSSGLRLTDPTAWAELLSPPSLTQDSRITAGSQAHSAGNTSLWL